MIIDHLFQNFLSLSNYLNWILPACKVVFGCEDRQEISKITLSLCETRKMKPAVLRDSIKKERKKEGRVSRFGALGDTVDRKKGKPPYSYISLIVMAILESPNRRQTLSGIIEHIQQRFPYYGDDCPAKGWKNSIRHNLSLNDCFEKTCRDPSNPSKGHLWRLHPHSTHMFEGGSFMRRKKRFRKDLENEKEESSFTPYDDFGSRKQEEHDFTMTSFRATSMTSFDDVTAPDGITASSATAAPFYFLPGGFSHGNRFQQQDFNTRNTLNLNCAESVEHGDGPGSILLPPSSSTSFCIICAGCTCYY